MRPKYTNRKGRPVRSKHVVVERMLPLLPKPVINGHSIVAMKVISQTTTSTDQLRPIAPRIQEELTEPRSPEQPLKNGSKFESASSFFSSVESTTTTSQEMIESTTQRVTSPTSISNFLDLDDIPTTDTNDLILQHSVAGAKENLTSFAG